MKLFYASLALTVAGNVLYHTSQKSIAPGVHPIVSIIASYITAILISILVLFAFPIREPLMAEVKRLNWATVAVGLSIVAVELGFLLAYRAGWRVSNASVSANTAVAILLIPIGMMLFHERLSFTNLAGLILCVIGLALVTR
jgi:drug/metabolite transporter (DMT)-like permease